MKWYRFLKGMPCLSARLILHSMLFVTQHWVAFLIIKFRYTLISMNCFVNHPWYDLNVTPERRIPRKKRFNLLNLFYKSRYKITNHRGYPRHFKIIHFQRTVYQAAQRVTGAVCIQRTPLPISNGAIVKYFQIK